VTGQLAVTQAFAPLLRRARGRIVLIGLKRGEPVPGLVTDELIYKGVTVIGAMAANYSSFERACRLIERDGDLIEDGVCALFIAEKLGVSQPTVSEHLKILAQARLVRAKRIKQWMFYKRDEANIRVLKRSVLQTF